MQAMQETTDWDFPNHTYLLDGSKMIAYIKQGEKTPFYFSKPITIDKRGRKFAEVKPNPFKAAPKTNLVAVAGSKGQTYYVDPEDKTCTCPGFQFRGNCKHLEMV
jgi:SWIM zinc finger